MYTYYLYWPNMSLKNILFGLTLITYKFINIYKYKQVIKYISI